MQKLEVNYTDELLDREVYAELAKMETDPGLKDTLEKLSKVELKHASLWKDLLTKKGIAVKEPGKLTRLRVVFYKLFRRLFGASLTVRLLESAEVEAIRKYRSLVDSGGFTDEEKVILQEILRDEVSHEELLVDEGLRVTGVKETIYGVSDGVVEVLAAVSGFSGIFLSPFVIAVAGTIVGVSGTLSMTVGAYLSTKSEEDTARSDSQRIQEQMSVDHGSVVKRVQSYLEGRGLSSSFAKDAASRMASNEEAVKKILVGTEEVSARRAALTTGGAYVLGFIPAVLPYALGLAGNIALLTSYLLCALWLATVGYLVGISGGTSPVRKAAQMVTLGILTALATHGLGLLASHYLHITV